MTVAELPTTEAPTTPSYVARYAMSYEEFLVWDHEGGLAEWVNGEVFHYATATLAHQRQIGYLLTVLGLFAQFHEAGLVTGPRYCMQAIPGGPGREPDLMFVATANVWRMASRQLDGPADLIVEVIADDSVARDRDEKFFEYQQAGVQEYWIIDPRPDRLRADFYVLDEQGRYQAVPLGADNIYHSTVLSGFWLKTDWLWQEEADALVALGQIVGVEKVLAALQQHG